SDNVRVKNLPKSARIIEGPWPAGARGLAMAPTQRAGRYLPPDQPCLVISSPYDEYYGPWPSRCQLPASGRPVLQFNLPFPDLPTLGQIARKSVACPYEPHPLLSPNLPAAVRRRLYGFV